MAKKRAAPGQGRRAREGAMLRLKIYERLSVAAPAWVRVKDPRFGEEALLAAVRRFRRSGGV